MSTSRSSELAGERVTLALDEIKPYWRNPRKITEEAVEGVRQSLHEYGYVQPIVVDGENVIIIGHTRYTAMRRLGVQTAEVLRRTDLPPGRVKELRVIDNRSHEYAWWNVDLLHDELDATKDDALVATLFPEASAPKDDGGADATRDEHFPPPGDDDPHEVEFICPSCFHEWMATITREQVMAGRITPSKES